MQGFEATLTYAREQDEVDILYPFRERFRIPQHEGRDVYYFCGNSLGFNLRVWPT